MDGSSPKLLVLIHRFSPHMGQTYYSIDCERMLKDPTHFMKHRNQYFLLGLLVAYA